MAVVVEGQSFENSDVTSLAASRGAIGVALFASMFNQRLCLPTTVSANDGSPALFKCAGLDYWKGFVTVA